jgi:hypothetical protein
MSRQIKKYGRDDLKKIGSQIENLKNEKHSKKILKILTDDPFVSFDHNANGIFINLSAAGVNTLDKVTVYLEKIKIKTPSVCEDEMVKFKHKNEHIDDNTYKLSNYEKNILKQRNIKKAIDNNSMKKN